MIRSCTYRSHRFTNQSSTSYNYKLGKSNLNISKSRKRKTKKSGRRKSGASHKARQWMTHDKSRQNETRQRDKTRLRQEKRQQRDLYSLGSKVHLCRDNWRFPHLCCTTDHYNTNQHCHSIVPWRTRSRDFHRYHPSPPRWSTWSSDAQGPIVGGNKRKSIFRPEKTRRQYDCIETRQCQTIVDKLRQAQGKHTRRAHETRQDKIRQHKTTQNNTIQTNNTQNQTKKTEQNKNNNKLHINWIMTLQVRARV